MHRIGWLFIGLAVLLVLTHGGFGFFFFPLIFLPLLWLLFWGGRGRYGYGWAGAHHGRCADSSREARGEPEPASKPEERSYTGETKQL